MLCSVKAVCKRVDKCGSAMEQKPDSGQPETAWTEKNVKHVAELICSQEDQPCTSKSMHQIAKTLQSARDLSIVLWRTWTCQHFAVFWPKSFLMQPMQSDFSAADGCWDVSPWRPLSRFSLLTKRYFTRTCRQIIWTIEWKWKGRSRRL